MKKLIIILVIILIGSVVHILTTQAAPTSTLVQYLIISDRASTGFILGINSLGLVVTSNDG
jgi:hypothetical protein